MISKEYTEPESFSAESVLTLDRNGISNRDHGIIDICERFKAISNNLWYIFEIVYKELLISN